MFIIYEYNKNGYVTNINAPNVICNKNKSICKTGGVVKITYRSVRKQSGCDYDEKKWPQVRC